jgi:aminocarboxymuconate-semialdehyde decarboxylase
VTSTNGHIDVHAHLVPRSLLEDLHSSPGRFPGIDVARHGETFTVAVNGGAPTRPVNPGLSDLGAGWTSSGTTSRSAKGSNGPVR